ncbi:MAG: DinB family protein [Planctomycetota bacterium]
MVWADVFARAAMTVRANAGDLTQEESLRRVDGANSANWVVGHMLWARNGVLEMLGAEPVEVALAAYVRGGGEGEMLEIGELRKLLRRSQKALEKAIDDADLDQPNPRPDPLTGETIGSAVAFAAFHDSYHAGQLGIIRRLLGKPGAIA